MAKKNEFDPTELEEPAKETAKRKGKHATLVSGAEYWNFEDNERFEGHYVGEVTAENDSTTIREGKPTFKKGDCIGFLFEDDAGEEHIISNSYSIEKALGMEIDGMAAKELSAAVFTIIFQGKGKNKAGQNFNRFKIGVAY